MEKIFTFLLLISNLSFGQVTSILDGIDFNDGTTLVGIANDDSENNPYKEYNFYIAREADANKVKHLFEYGYEMQNKSTEENYVMIYALKNKKIVNQWLVNPKLYNLFNDGNAYSYNAENLYEVAQEFPFKYKIIKTVYKNKKEYLKAKKNLDKDFSVLLITEPDFAYEGSFLISLKKDNTIINAEEAEKYLKNIIKDLTKKDFSVAYALVEENFINTNQITVLVSSPKEVFDKLVIPEAKKGDWQPEINEGTVLKRL